jgi:ABC-type nickel/cobalt efflux system permease component RcnA
MITSSRLSGRLGIFVALILLAAGIGGAHPLGIFSVNRYARIEPAHDVIRLFYVMDVAEIPSIQEFTKIDANGDGFADVAEKDHYAAAKLAELARSFQMTLDGRSVLLHPVRHDLSFPEGQGGLKTTRLTALFESPLAGDAQIHDLHFADHNFADRIGWKEIIVRPGSGVEVQHSSAGREDLTDELRNYPADRLTNPVVVPEASLQFVSNSSASPFSVSSITQGVISRTRDGFAELISAKELSAPVIVLSLLIAFMLGAGHALTPGHGKTIVGAYLVGSRGTAKHAAFLGLTVTVTHTIGVFIMGLIALFASKYILPETLFPWLGTISGLLVVGIGVSLFLKRLRSARGGAIEHSHSHTHEREHTHDGVHYHTHLPPGADGSPVTWKSLLALGISGGMLPCPSAIVVLLSAVALGRIGFGLLLIVAFSIGLAGVLTGIGLMMVYARRFFERFKTTGPMVRWLPVASALVVTIAGAVIAFQAFLQTGIQMPADFWGNGLSLTTGSLSVLGLGFVLGLKHALDADHLVAVSTIVSERKNLWSSSLVGALWGLGHTASLLIVGLLVILFNVQIPDKVAMSMEFAVAIMLVILGVNLLRKIRKGGTLHTHTHEHAHHVHAHPHLHEAAVVHSHDHAGVHHHKKTSKKPFIIGMVHGMAGSAALMLVVLATISSRMVGLLYIGIFGLGSVGGMFLMSALISIPFAVTARHEGLNKVIQTTAGIVSVSFGLFLVWQIGFAEGLLL